MPTYTFDPHPGNGGIAGMGVLRSCLVGGVLLLLAMAIYQGVLWLSAVLLLVGLPVALTAWEGRPAVVWLAERAVYALTGPRRWEIDPELLGMSDPVLLTRSQQEEGDDA